MRLNSPYSVSLLLQLLRKQEEVVDFYGCDGWILRPIAENTILI